MMSHPFSRSHLLCGWTAAGFLGTGLLLSAPAQASVLVQPRILQTEPDTPTPAEAFTARPGQDVAEVASGVPGLDTLTAAIDAASLGDFLSESGPLTVFAPTDDAFAALPAGTLDALLLPQNRDLLALFLYNHFAYGDLTSDKLETGELSMFTTTVDVAITPTGVTVAEANLIQADIMARNGVIHIVDQVLLPAEFSQRLQARIDGAETASPPVAPPTNSPVVIREPAAPPAAPVEESATPVEEPAADDDEGPVRALW